MKKSEKCIPILLLLCILLTCTACEEKYDNVTYYKTIGVGYVFMYDSIGYYPVEKAEITITNCLQKCGFYVSHPKETVTTDECGRYKLHFIKRNQLCNTWKYILEMRYTPQDSNIGWLITDIVFYPEDVINAPNGIMTFDTLKIFVNELNYKSDKN